MNAPRIRPLTFALGGDLAVHRLGFGAMRLTGQPGNFGDYADWAGGVALVRRAHALGVDFFDSARSYGPGSADRLLGEALEGTDAVLATKGGVDKPAPGRIVVDGSRDTLHRQVDDALTRLRRDRIDLFQLHRIDRDVGLEHSVAALDEARRDGRIRHIGLSNVTRAELDRARAVAPIASVQNRLSLAHPEDVDLVHYAAEHGIAYIPYGPLGARPMHQGARLDPTQALSWLLDLSDNVIVIPGTTSVAHLEENVRVGR
jgi:aryl-alcohol dehydrogenase-like predicted oxidoreductase